MLAARPGHGLTWRPAGRRPRCTMRTASNTGACAVTPELSIVTQATTFRRVCVSAKRIELQMPIGTNRRRRKPSTRMGSGPRDFTLGACQTGMRASPFSGIGVMGAGPMRHRRRADSSPRSRGSAGSSRCVLLPRQRGRNHGLHFGATGLAWGDAQRLPWLRVKGKGKFALPPVAIRGSSCDGGRRQIA